MAHTLTITQVGGSTIDLAALVPNGSTGWSLKDLRLPQGSLVHSDIANVPLLDGLRLIRTGHEAQEITYTGTYYGSSADTVDAAVIALTKVLYAAEITGPFDAQNTVYLTFKRQGTTNAVTWRVLGAVAMPHLTGDTEDIEAQTLANHLEMSFTVRVEPLPHASTASTLTFSGSSNCSPSSTILSASGPSNGPPTPLALKITNTTAATSWSKLWIIQSAASTVDLASLSGTVDAQAHGGAVQRTAIGTSSTGTISVGSRTYSSTHGTYPVRVLVSYRLSAVAPTSLYLRSISSISSSTVYGPWVNIPPTESGNIGLLDLGMVRLPDLSKGTFSTLGTWTASLGYKNLSASTSYTLDLDWVLYPLTKGFTYLAAPTGASIGTDSSITYEEMSADSPYVYPLRSPRSLRLSSSNVAQGPMERSGRLSPPKGGEAVYLKIFAQGSAFTYTDTFTLSAYYLPTFSAPLRGSA